MGRERRVKEGGRAGRGRGRTTGPWRILGTMSGTSLDGVDVALIESDGERILRLGPGRFRRYPPRIRARLRAALGLWPGGTPADDRLIERAARTVERQHAIAIRNHPAFPGDVDLVAFHGQTLAHEPRGRGTHQAGDGARLAAALGRPVVWDFRSADVALGGEGAPLVPVFHHALARHLAFAEPVAFLNIGGVANITLVDPRLADPAGEGALLAFDTGPGGALLDDFIARRAPPGAPRFDMDGRFSAEGRVDEAVIRAFLGHPFFLRVPPKSLDRDAFSDLAAAVEAMPLADGAATLVAASAAAVGAAFEQLPVRPGKLILCGGGRRNPTLRRAFGAAVPEGVELVMVDEFGLDGDMIEAWAFGHIAARIMRGLPTSFPSTTGVPASVAGGRISGPGAAGAGVSR